MYQQQISHGLWLPRKNSDVGADEVGAEKKKRKRKLELNHRDVKWAQNYGTHFRWALWRCPTPTAGIPNSREYENYNRKWQRHSTAFLKSTRKNLKTNKPKENEIEDNLQGLMHKRWNRVILFIRKRRRIKTCQYLGLSKCRYSRNTQNNKEKLIHSVV